MDKPSYNIGFQPTTKFRSLTLETDTKKRKLNFASILTDL